MHTKDLLHIFRNNSCRLYRQLTYQDITAIDSKIHAKNKYIPSYLSKSQCVKWVNLT